MLVIRDELRGVIKPGTAIEGVPPGKLRAHLIRKSTLYSCNSVEFKTKLV